MPDSASVRRARDQAGRQLSLFAVTIEFTLISVMVGVVIFPLMDYATPLLRELQIEFWLYILCGALIVIGAWTEVIVHTLSIVGWPLDMARNALYIAAAIIVAIQMHFLGDPRGWFAMSVPAGLIVVIILVYDLTLVEQKLRAANQPAATAIFNAVAKRQRRATLQGAAYYVFILISFGLVVLFPSVFIEQRAHLILIALQTLGNAYILMRTIRDFKTWSEPILQAVVEQFGLGDEQ